jgi:hypothetical protein
MNNMSVLLHPEGSPLPPSWQERISITQSEPELVSTARDFLAQYSPQEIASLPRACRPGRLVDGDDVADFAITLVRHECTGEGADHILHRLSTFFAHAARRLAEIRHSDAQQSA